MIPTAEEFMNRPFGQKLDTQTLMIEFAQLHVKAALKEASEKAELESYDYPGASIKESSIINAYPLTNIK